MKHLVIIAFITLLFFCTCKSSSLSITTLPSEDLINEVIHSVILQNSLNRDCGIIKYIDVPDVYSLQKWDGNPKNPPPPPPPSAYGYSFNELFMCFDSESDPKRRQLDSLFIIQQIDTKCNYKINKKVSQLFKHIIYESYYFSRPIFSNDKNTAIITYHLNFHKGTQTILKKTENKWVVVSHRIAWER